MELCQLASEVSLLTGVRIIVAPQSIDLREAAQVCGIYPHSGKYG
ncbi:MAG: hypothetical protein QXT25_02520 [Candidatus Anstonellaceae archaeon]